MRGFAPPATLGEGIKIVPALTSRHASVRWLERGHAETDKYSESKPGFLATQIQRHFQIRQDWYRAGEVADLVLEYYLVLRSVLRAKPHLRRCLTRCKHCRIFFPTHPRNAGRKDLRCPYGCREVHRKQRSTERSEAYYGTKEGQVKKRMQNDKRRGQSNNVDEECLGEEKSSTGAVCEAQEGPCSEEILAHVRMATSQIEGRKVSREEILRMLERAMRQHSIGRERRMDYLVRILKEHPR